MPKPKQSSKPRKSVKKSTRSNVQKVLNKSNVSNVLTKEAIQKEENKCEKQVLCLSDSDYDIPNEEVDIEEVDIKEQTFFKHLDNEFINYDSDNDDEIVKEYDDTESLDTNSANMSGTLKYDSDNDDDVVDDKQTKTRPLVNTK